MRELFLLDEQKDESWMSGTLCMSTVDKKVNSKRKMGKQKEQLLPQLTCFHMPEIIPFFMIHPACP